MTNTHHQRCTANSLVSRPQPGRSGKQCVHLQSSRLQLPVYCVPLTISAAADKGELREDEAFASAILKRKIRASVYLPPSFEATRRSESRFPVVYLLHGLGDNHRAWPRLGKIKPTLDQLIGAGKLRPVIVIMPDAASSWYVNDHRVDGNGRVFDAFRSDLIAAVDARYPTAACRQGRAIGGLSMGGYGALLLGFARPNLYAAVFSLSGAVFAENLSEEPKRRKFLASLFRGVHGEPIEDKRLAEWNIFDRLRSVVHGPQATPQVWLSAGDDDFFPSIVSGTVRVYQILQRAKIPAELRIDDATHHWSYWRRSVAPALTWASAKLSDKCPPKP